MKSIYTLFLMCACFLLTLSLAHAKEVPFEEMLRKPDVNQTLTVFISDFVQQESIQETKVWEINTKPLFLTHPNQPAQENSFITTRTNPSLVYKQLKNTPHLQNTSGNAQQFEVKDGRVTVFSPAKPALHIDYTTTTRTLLSETKSNKKIEITSFAESLDKGPTNPYGIIELIGGGVSDFSGSSSNRITNIKVATELIKGTLVKPGGTFSFGDALGDITPEKGFKPEIVIKADGLKPELGGGVCQVSSTLFRALMQSGLSITRRYNHSFSIGHYLPPGTDSTIYTPHKDLVFANNTAHHVLIWPYFEKNRLIVDFYGTRDGRSTEVLKPTQWDKKANGAVKASWKRIVTQNGKSSEDEFTSTYLPPALFKKEEIFVPQTQPNTNPETTNTENNSTPTNTPTPTETPTP